MNRLTKWQVATVVLTTVVAPVGASAMVNIGGNTIATNLAGSGFVDLNKADSWAQGAIAKVKELGIMVGGPNGYFRPHDSITRQELAVIVTKALNFDVSDTSSSSFSDVTASTWGRNYIEVVNKAGIMSGDGNGQFRPTDPVSREELAVVLAKAAKVNVAGKGVKLSIADKDSVSGWASDYVEEVIELGLMKGDGVHFNPKAHATRQEIAVVSVNIANMLAQLAHGSVIQAVADGTVTIDGVTYQTSDHVKGILNKGNADVLKGARVKFEADNGTLDKITYLEITSSGKAPGVGENEFSGDLVLHGNNGTIDGDVMVASDYISLENQSISGDLIISPELQNDFYSSNLKVNGKTIVNGGASNPVVFDNATLGEVDVNKEDVRVRPEGTTTVSSMTISSNATITADAGVTIPRVTLLSGATTVQLDAHNPDGDDNQQPCTS